LHRTGCQQTPTTICSDPQHWRVRLPRGPDGAASNATRDKINRGRIFVLDRAARSHDLDPWYAIEAGCNPVAIAAMTVPSASAFVPMIVVVKFGEDSSRRTSA